MRKRAAIFGIVVIAIIAAYISWRIVNRAPQKSSLATYVQDLKKAKHEAGESYQRYAYRVYHYTEDAFDDMPWHKVVQSLKQQGVEVEEFPYDLRARVPAADFVLPSGGKFELTIRLRKREIPSATEPTRFAVSHAFPELMLTIDKPYSADLIELFARDTFLREVFERPGLKQICLKYPKVGGIQLEYRIPGIGLGLYPAPPPPTEGDLTARIGVSREKNGKVEGIYLDYSATTELEPKRRRIVSWIPWEMTQSFDRFGRIIAGGEDGNAGSGFGSIDYFSLRRPSTNVEEQPSEIPGVVYSNPDLKALPESTKEIELIKSDQKLDLKLLRRFKSLRILRAYGDHATSNGDASEIAKLKGLRDLNITLETSKMVPAIARMSNLETLSMQVNKLNPVDLQSLRNHRTLKAITFSHLPDPNAYLSVVSSIPNLESLSINAKNGASIRSLRSLTRIPKLKDLTINIWEGEKVDMDVVSDIPNLEVLWLSGGKLSDRAVRRMATFPGLQEAHFANSTGLSNSNIQAFAGAKNLRDLTVSECQGPTYQGFLKLKAKLPKGFTGPGQ